MSSFDGQRDLLLSDLRDLQLITTTRAQVIRADGQTAGPGIADSVGVTAGTASR